MYEGVPILAAWQAQPLAGEAVQAAVKADLVTRGRVTSSVLGESAARAGDAPELLTEALVRDIALRCCFVTNINRGRQLRELMEEQGGDAAPTTPPHLAPLVNYPISGSQFLQVEAVTTIVIIDKDYKRFDPRLTGSRGRAARSCSGGWTMTASPWRASSSTPSSPARWTAGGSWRTASSSSAGPP